MACIRLKGRAVVERLDPSRVAVEDGPDAAERVQAFIERDYRIRSGLCPNGCGLMGPFPDPDNCSHDSKTTTIGPTTDQRNHHCPDCGKLWTTWPTDEERRAVIAGVPERLTSPDSTRNANVATSTPDSGHAPTISNPNGGQHG
jgi:hypothetical protein